MCKSPTESAATWCGASSRFARSSTRTSLSRRSPTAFPSAGEFPPSLARTSCGAAYRSPTGSERCHPRARSSSGSAGRRVELAHAGSLTKRCTSSGRANRRVRPKAAVGRSLGHRPSRVRRSGLPSVLSTCHSPRRRPRLLGSCTFNPTSSRRSLELTCPRHLPGFARRTPAPSGWAY